MFIFMTKYFNYKHFNSSNKVAMLKKRKFGDKENMLSEKKLNVSFL